MAVMQKKNKKAISIQLKNRLFLPFLQMHKEMVIKLLYLNTINVTKIKEKDNGGMV